MGSSNVADAIRCAVVGDQSLAAECAEIAVEHGLDIVVIATHHPVVASFAELHGIPHVDSAVGLAAALLPYEFDVLFSIANLRILPDAVLEQAKVRINFHDGPLPGYAGLNVTSWAILGGEETHGIAWHLMTPEVDAGEIVTTETFDIRPDETAFGLNARCYEAALASFPRIAAALADGSLATTPQPAGTSRLFRKHERPCSVFDPADPAAVIDRAVRAHAIGDRVRNTLGAVRLVLDHTVYVVNDVQLAAATDAAIGAVVTLDDTSVRVRAADADVVITAVSRADGTAANPSEVVASHGLGVGSVIASPDASIVAALRELDPQLSRHEETWLDRLGSIEIPALPAVRANGAADWASHDVAVPSGASTDQIVAALSAWCARTTSTPDAVFAATDPQSREIVSRLGALVQLPIGRVDTAAPDFATLTVAAATELAWLGKHGTFLSDAVGRDPRTHGRGFDAPVMIAVDLDDTDPSATLPHDATTLCFAVAPNGGRLTLHHRVDRIDLSTADRIARQVATLLRAGVDDPTGALSSLEMLSEAEVAELDQLNDTDLDHDRATTIDRQFRAQVGRTPDAPAVSSGSRTLSYAELATAVDELSGRLRAAGVGARDRVGIAVHRGIDMLVSVLATLECGAAYVPLDPTYPEDRLRFMVADSGLVALLAQGEIASLLSHGDVTVVDPADRSGSTTTEPAAGNHGPADLAYVIYTSGSTGTPKGVMLEHHNVVNFFAAMDEVIEHDEPGVWLAVTSLSFDISVLELLWTLTRGFHIVLKSESGVRGDSSGTASRAATALRPVSMSMFYFAAGEDRAHEGYRLLLESARFADRNGFEAVWTPERHFHAFGGSYPNPSVVGAAVAAITERIHVRAGSVVLPLHSPVRVAEEWAIVDNLTNGRTGISFAAGWQPNDFVLNPSAYANAREGLPGMIDTVARLWRGEAVTLPGHDGLPVEVRTLPRPVQAELPIWLTSAGSTSTFERAGTLGTNVLTHLLGQSVEQLSNNIAAYRRAWTEAGHAGEGRVTLMLHTFLDRDAAVAKEMAREPMKSYLGTAVGLLKDMASAFPTFANSGKGADEAFKSLTPDEMSQLLDMAAARYLETSGLFGTPDDAVELIERVSAIGVDEVACLIDFGVDTDAVLDSLELMREAKDVVDAARSVTAAVATDDEPDDRPATSMAELVERHGVTHLQCTPSLAAMLLADPADRAGLASVRHMMVGGEALPTALANEMRRILPERFTNMYGPTETTIWSLVHEISDVAEGSIPIGLPIGNNTVYVLDDEGRRVPVGVFGELHIGGEGVARGYHGRDELTASRFVERPGLGRVYATGDVVRIHPDRFVEFAGRSDNQVKIRGHRIELGEIETVLDAHPDVVQSVVVARGDVTDPRLVAFVIVRGGTTTDPDTLRKHVADTLPDVMVPAAVMVLEAFPLTPNGKIDRKALPDGPTGVALAEPTAPPAGDTEQLVARIWTEELARPVGRDDNFFEIGGHSLLAVKVFRRLSDETDAALALTDIFRYPTVRAFAVHLARAMDGSVDSDTSDAAAAPTGTDRGAMRRRARSRQ
ncbi:MAG TPA: MupA/Atu3671 family FMN-dependent luciferase-like monooxygenase [Ilumatobacteraceae bacterium]|nr:MupA/Atu3671 family FMN-dependent luciferase-like monooxygenase [Ilumatobacteraceae bacterium]